MVQRGAILPPQYNDNADEIHISNYLCYFPQGVSEILEKTASSEEEVVESIVQKKEMRLKAIAKNVPLTMLFLEQTREADKYGVFEAEF